MHVGHSLTSYSEGRTLRRPREAERRWWPGTSAAIHRVPQGTAAPNRPDTCTPSSTVWRWRVAGRPDSAVHNNNNNNNNNNKSNQIKSNLFAIVKMHNKQFIKITFHLAGQTGDNFALMSAHKN